MRAVVFTQIAENFGRLRHKGDGASGSRPPAFSGGVQRRKNVVANEVAQKAGVGIAVVFDPGEFGALDVGGDFVA